MGKEYDYISTRQTGDAAAGIASTEGSFRPSNRFIWIAAIAGVGVVAIAGIGGHLERQSNAKADLAIGNCFANRVGAVGIVDQRIESGKDPSYRLTFESGVRSVYRSSEISTARCPSLD